MAHSPVEGRITKRLRQEILRRGGWVLSRVEVPLQVAADLRSEGLEIPGKLGGAMIEENSGDPSGTRFVFRCLDHSRPNCPLCLGSEKTK